MRSRAFYMPQQKISTTLCRYSKFHVLLIQSSVGNEQEKFRASRKFRQSTKSMLSEKKAQKTDK